MACSDYIFPFQSVRDTKDFLLTTGSIPSNINDTTSNLASLNSISHSFLKPINMPVFNPHNTEDSEDNDFLLDFNKTNYITTDELCNLIYARKKITIKYQY